MPNFDLVEVENFVADLEARITRCENGEGMECTTIDELIRHHGMVCFEFIDRVRAWANGIFSGQIAFDEEVERLWKTEGARLLSRAKEMYDRGKRAEEECYILDGRSCIMWAGCELAVLLEGWISPKLAIGPAARHNPVLPTSAALEAESKIASLPPLPADWVPADPKQEAWYRTMQRS